MNHDTGSPILTQIPIPVSSKNTEHITEVFIRYKEGGGDNTPEIRKRTRSIDQTLPEGITETLAS